MTTNRRTHFDPDVTQHECCKPRVILLCMGLFSQFCVRTLRCAAEEATAPQKSPHFAAQTQGRMRNAGHAIEAVLNYVETHHWIFGFAVIGYLFYLHDRNLHARFDALDKRIDEIRKRLAVDY